MAFSLSHPEGKQTNKHLSQEQTKPNKQQKPKQNPKTDPQMCYLLIICDFQTLCPWGTQLTDFLPTKSDFC